MRGIERERIGRLPVWGWAVGVGAAVLALYAATLAPSTAFWDTSEYIATAHILGLPHPPGNPLFVLMGRAWILLTGWTGLEVAPRINLLSAVASAAAAAFWFLAVLRIWAHFTPDRRIALVAGLLAVLLGATAYTVWSQSNVNEKVYTVSLLFVAVITYLAMVWEDHADDWRGDRLVLAVAFLLGLGSTNHQMSLMPVVALGVFLVWHRWRTLLRWRLMSLAVVFGLVGYSVQLLFVPIRSARDPIIDEADPECAELVDAVIPDIEATLGAGVVVPQCEALAASIEREQYQKPPLSERQAPFGAQLRNYWQYFDWQWARPVPPAPRLVITFVFLGLGIVGLWRHWKGDPDSFVYFGVLLATVTVLLVYYLNFRYGYSLAPDVPVDQHEVRERDYFYILSFNIWGLYAGMGLVSLWRTLATRIAARRGTSLAGGLRTASPLLGVAILPLLLNFPLADRRGDYAARDWAYNLLQSVEPYAVLFTNGDNDTFPLWYLQEVEGIRRDVTVIVHSYLGTKWYPRQLRELARPCDEGEDPLATPTVIVCQRPFEPGTAPEIYEDRGAVPPSRSILSMSDEEIDRVPAYDIVPAGFEVGFSEDLRVEFSQERFITHPDFLVFRIIRDSLGDRPVYFAATAPPVYQRWNLAPHLVRQGLALKLEPGILESTTDRVRLPEELIGSVQWIDMDRTRKLLWDVFQLEYLLEWTVWPEPSTRSSIPAQYFVAHYALSEALRMREEPEAAERTFERGARLFALSERHVP